MQRSCSTGLPATTRDLQIRSLSINKINSITAAPLIFVFQEMS
jgi:hypothetical protein